MTKILKPLPTNPYQQFRYQLFEECPRAAFWLEAMVFGILAQGIATDEDSALEIAVKIVAAPQEATRRTVGEKVN